MFALHWWAWLLIGVASIVVVIALLITLLVFDKSMVLDDPPYPTTSVPLSSPDAWNYVGPPETREKLKKKFQQPTS